VPSRWLPRPLPQARYIGSLSARLRCWSVAALALSLALAAGGCSYRMESLTGKFQADAADPDITGSVTPSSVVQPMAELAGADLVIARATVNEALSKAGKDTSVPWENPATGARGTVTPLARSYVQDGQTCHDFLASYVSKGSESWLQGEACRRGQGGWQVRQMTPWRRT
jgi:surface antigen